MSYIEEYEGTRYKYIEGMEEKVLTERYQREEYLESLVLRGEISLSDLYLMRAVTFFRVCTARMVAEWLLYFRSRYGDEACMALPLPQQDGGDVINMSDGLISNKFVADIDGCLSRLGNLSAVIHIAYVNRTSGGGRSNQFIAM